MPEAGAGRRPSAGLSRRGGQLGEPAGRGSSTGGGPVTAARGATPGWRSTLARLGASWSGRIGGTIALLLLAVAALGPTLYPVDPYRMAIGQRLRPPSAQHLLGTDEFGRDLLARIIHGSRISLRVGLISVAHRRARRHRARARRGARRPQGGPRDQRRSWT